MDESKGKSEDLAATDCDSDQNRYLLDDGLPPTSFDCSILSEFGWTTTTATTTTSTAIQQQRNSIHHFHGRQHRRRHSTEESMPLISESSSGSVSGFSHPSAGLRRLQVDEHIQQVSSCNNNYQSVSSSSSDQDLLDKSICSDDQNPTPPNVQIIPNKKRGQKRIRQQRFAFLTKSEVDHLEDGYRWRKYGQKAVKNSPYPRSYYRCTNTKCTVKKRVERSCEDPTNVITTYEGQHCHQIAGFPRGGGLSIREVAFGVQMGPPDSQFYYPRVQHLPQQSSQGSIAPTTQLTSVPGEPRDNNGMNVHTEPPLPLAGSSPQFPSDEGLLGDIVSPRLRNNFHP